MNAAQQRRLTPVLALLAVLLGTLLLLLFAGIGGGVQWHEPRRLAPLPPVTDTVDLPRPVPLQQFAQVWQDPLFSPDRKPISHAANGSSLGDLELTGVIITPGLRMALLHDKHGNQEVRLREGQSLPDGSATLAEIRPRSALFDSPAGRTELKLPAGAVIDEAKPGTAPVAQPAGTMWHVVPGAAGGKHMPAGQGRHPGTIMPMRPSGKPAPASSSQGRPAAALLDRLRENIQRRRAAASHQGVR
ncbi:MAG: general secretion pathway protein GspN [Xanthomonadaceae bacterium]|nr:general secretion pathway protein GspN [Xanthomonadaceae bacterium]MDE2307294.1 general secretion pathway protein GspN [Xanthomonadaceae bacterium]